MKNEIFLSCDHRDYNKAKKVYEYLKENLYSVFFADKSIRMLGNADYRKVIDSALDSCNHLLVYTSKPEYTKSTWVEYEWGSFCNEKRSGRKSGNLIVITEGEINISNLPYALRNTQVIAHQDCSEYLIHFSKNDEVADFFTLKKGADFFSKKIHIKYLFMSTVCFTILTISTMLYFSIKERERLQEQLEQAGNTNRSIDNMNKIPLQIDNEEINQITPTYENNMEK